MADVCIIYAREDAKHIPPILESLLSPEFTVWWDKKIIEGDFREEILHQLRIAGCVVPIWSPAAASGCMILDEATHARDVFGTPLLPIKIHNGPPPLSFGADQYTDVIGLEENARCPEILEHIDKIRTKLQERRGAKCRPIHLLKNKNVRFPAFFFSLSSYETKISPCQGVQVLDALSAKSVLISAQDTADVKARSQLVTILKRIRKSGGTVLLDSGMYEEGRISNALRPKGIQRRSSSSLWTLDKYYDALEATPHDLSFCFDKIAPPPNNLDKIVANSVKPVRRDQKYSSCPVLPIIHLPYDRKTGKVLTELAPEAAVRVAKAIEPPLIGVPERELGEGVIARIGTMRRIRTALDENLSYYQPVHVLGTGDPISIALLTAAGADSFDGLEWCRFVLDWEFARIYPIKDYDLFEWQLKLSRIDEGMSVFDEDNELTWLGNVAVHNIEFYLYWVETLRMSLDNKRKLTEFLTNLLPRNANLNKVWEALGDDLQ